MLVPEPNVFWLRHKTFKAFAKEAYRYGLGDGESMINFRNLWSHMAEIICRYSFFLVLLLLPIILVSGHFWLSLLLLPLSFGLRSYRHAWRNWKKMPYGTGILINCFRLIEMSRWQYLKGYFKGWLFPSPAQKEGRKALTDIR